MAKRGLSTIETLKEPQRFLICPKCQKKYRTDQFMKSDRFPGGYMPCCKECMYDLTINVNGLNRDGLVNLCQFLDLPFIQNDFDEAKSKYVKPMQPKKQLSYYLCTKMRMKSRENLYFKDSIFSKIEGLDDVEEVVDLGEDFTPGEIESAEEKAEKDQQVMKKKTELFKELQSKWGKFSSFEYLQRCEDLYVEITSGGYSIKSAMHEISLKNYCKLQVDWDIAQEAKDYVTMDKIRKDLSEARTSARLNPNQFKPSDFSNTGANSFSEITAVLSKKDGFIPFPMKYYKRPNDALDFLMWELINYDRHCLNLPEIPYSEVYKHYCDRVDEFNKQYNADIENGDLGTLDESTNGRKRNWTII